MGLISGVPAGSCCKRLPKPSRRRHACSQRVPGLVWLAAPAGRAIALLASLRSIVPGQAWQALRHLVADILCPVCRWAAGRPPGGGRRVEAATRWTTGRSPGGGRQVDCWKAVEIGRGGDRCPRSFAHFLTVPGLPGQSMVRPLACQCPVPGPCPGTALFSSWSRRRAEAWCRPTSGRKY